MDRDNGDAIKSEFSNEKLTEKSYVNFRSM